MLSTIITNLIFKSRSQRCQKYSLNSVYILACLLGGRVGGQRGGVVNAKVDARLGGLGRTGALGTRTLTVPWEGNLMTIVLLGNVVALVLSLRRPGGVCICTAIDDDDDDEKEEERSRPSSGRVQHAWRGGGSSAGRAGPGPA